MSDRPLSPAEYQKLKAAGYSDEEIRADGLIPPTTPSSAPAVASDATKAMTSRTEQPETQHDPYGPARTMVNALTLGTEPTIRGAVHAIGSILPGGRSPSEAYREEKDAEIGGVQNYAARHPMAAAGLNVVAGLPLLLAGGGAAAPSLATKTPATFAAKAGLAARNLGLGVGTGGLMGGLSTFGGTEGSLTDQLKATPRGVGEGMALGGGTAALLGTAAAVKRKVSPLVRSLVGKPSGAQLEQGTDEALMEWLARTGQTPKDVSQRTGRIKAAGVPSVTTGEAMGPAGPLVAKNMGALNPEVAGEAFTAGKVMQEASRSPRIASPVVNRRYADAFAVGGVQLPPKGQTALQYLQAKFPKLREDLVAYLDAEAIKDPTIWDRMVTPQGDFTVEYYDLLKKRIDNEVYGLRRAAKTDATASAWLKNNRKGVKHALAELVQGVDAGVQAKTGGAAYQKARELAQSGIEEQDALSDTRASLGKELQKASGRVNPEGLMEEATAIAQFGAQRPKMGFFQTLVDPLKSGVRATARKQAGSTFSALMHSDPELLFRELAQRELERQAKLGRGTAFRSITAAGLAGRRNP